MTSMIVTSKMSLVVTKDLYRIQESVSSPDFVINIPVNTFQNTYTLIYNY